MYLIAGLGNIGSLYDLTIHNMGFEVIDYFSDKFNIKINRTKFRGDYGKGNIDGEDIILLKPRTYMNSSGKCIKPFLDYFKVDVENLIVIYDDVELERGVLRIRKKGSAGTHNGMKSIIENIGDNNFTRIRLGMGQDKDMDLADYVLKKIPKEDIPIMQDIVINASDALHLILTDGIDKAMNLYNRKER